MSSTPSPIIKLFLISLATCCVSTIQGILRSLVSSSFQTQILLIRHSIVTAHSFMSRFLSHVTFPNVY